MHKVKTRFKFLYERAVWELITDIQGQYFSVIEYNSFKIQTLKSKKLEWILKKSTIKN